MKKVLEQAPLVHTLIHLKFADLPTLQPITEELQQTLHLRMMEEGFAEKIVSKADIAEWHYDNATQQMRHKKLSKERLLFRASGEKEIVEISESSIILKSTAYTTFSEFYDKFHRVLKGCIDLIPRLDSTLLKSVGLRYIDVIAPVGHSSLEDFVSSEIQPPKLANLGKHLQGHSLKAMKVSENQVLVLNFEELPTVSKRIHKVLPDNLMEPDEKCGLIIDGQKEWLEVESETYGILDIDHTYHFERSPKFDLVEIKTATNMLYQLASDVFWQTITEKAKKAWGYKEV
ncbi:TIGR04255 family protein [Pseudoalteromonas undina]|uniref:TIGR04255 family protein n=1 Tax=Pseudoalteromonas undina TaxID=43660 RepID=A0ACC6R9W5_9GAMM